MAEARESGGRGRPERQLGAEEKCALLLEISRRSAGTLDLARTLDLLLDAVATVVDYDAAGIFALNADLYPERSRPRGVIAGVARRGFRDRPLDEDAMLSGGRGLVGHAIRSGQTVRVPDVRLDPRYVVGREETLSEVAVPIAVSGRTVAALDVESDRLAAFGEREVASLEFFAEAAALAIEKALLHRHLLAAGQVETQLRIAREVQDGLLPAAAPELPGYDLAGRCLPSLELAGDYFDFLPCPDGRLGLVIADVAGKGVPAALIMATFRALLRSRHELGDSLAETVGSVGRLLRESAAPRAFVTCCYAVLEPASGRLAYASCGHPLGLVARAGGGLEELENCGPALGVFADALHVEREVRLAPGDRLLLYTDGLVEAADAAGEQFGGERLRALLTEGRGLTAAALVDRLVAGVRGFAASPQLADDLTLLVLGRAAAG